MAFTGGSVGATACKTFRTSCTSCAPGPPGSAVKWSRSISNSLRHTFASLLIAKGLDVVFVSRQLGHASPATTLGVYAHLFDQVQHAATARAALEESYQTMTGTQPRESRGPAGGSVVALMVAGESGPAAH